jgi:hypothetical protein
MSAQAVTIAAAVRISMASYGVLTWTLTSQHCERGGRTNNATLALARYFLPPSPSALVPRVGPFGAGLFSAAPRWRLGTVAVEPERAQDASVHIWLDPGVLAKLKALRGPGESYSDVIL